MGARTDSAPTVLLTGSSGFTGVYVRDELERHGYVVVGVSLRDSPSAIERRADLCDVDAIRSVVLDVRPDYVVHLGGIASPQHTPALDFYATNLFGTTNLLDACLAAPPKRVVLASSANVYGLPEGGPVEESAFPRPLSHYATSKLAMEHMARTYASRLPLVMTRPFNYTGRGQSETFVVPKIVEHFARRAPVLELGNVDVARDFSDVRDVARMYRLLLKRDIEPGTVVNLASGVAYSLKFVIERLSENSGFEPEIRVNPAFVRPNDVPLLVGSTRLLESLVGPLERTPFEHTLSWMLGSG